MTDNVKLNDPDPNVRLRARIEDALRTGNNDHGLIEVHAEDLGAILTSTPTDAQVLEAFLCKLAGDGAYALDFSSADALHGHIVHLLKRDIAALHEVAADA